jgi:alkylation response protein AidB-like acyl-CoA dehydrogenase
MTRDFSIDNPHRAISMWLVPLDLPGFTVQPMEKAVTWTTNTCDVFIDNVRAPQSCLVGQENNGFLQLMKNFEIERLMLCSTGLGYAEAAFEDAAVYANQRVQFGQPIGYNQQIQLMLANMAVKIENMKNMIYKTVWMLDHDMPVVKETAMAKLYCGQSCCEVIDDAIQIYGALGLMSDVRLQRMWRDARTLRIGGGADQIMVNILGKTILKEHRNAKDRK